jgi:RNA polymerase sigma-70 factor (ECF subfamily)
MGVVIEELPPTPTDADACDEVCEDAESALARRLAAGDRSAFDQLVEHHAPGVSRLAYRLLGWTGRAADVEDVVQDVFVAVLRGMRKFDGRSSLSTWITAITVNRCRSLRRRLAARVRAFAGLLARSRESPHESADQALGRADESERVRRAVRRLKLADREVIVLHYFEHADASQAAAILGVSKNAVEVRLHRARQRLKRILESDVEPE